MNRSKGPLPGGGPWRILDECKSQTHNWLASARKTHLDPACFCPRTLVTLEENRTKKKAAYAARVALQRAKLPVPKTTRVYVTGPQYGDAYMKDKPGERPNLMGAPCTTKEGIPIFESAHEQGGANKKERVEKAKELCDFHCFVREACLQWAGSKPGRDWDAIYGGMTQKERRSWFKEKSQSEERQSLTSSPTKSA